ncbi:S8 family peptidase [Camelliibacillus cellulosilyticus]|uniref:S8 family peptidase n=1 Tax=Camelliibacillus cellulosilyticus TaxID=2174486 RepID=A0ABV9GMI0_9BACL
MFDYSIVQLARRKAQQLDREMRRNLVRLYHPFRKVPCFLHRPLDALTKRLKKLPVIVEFERDVYIAGLSEVKAIKAKIRHTYPRVACCSAKLSIKAIENLLENGSHIKKIHFDRKINALLDVASPSLNVPPLNKTGLTGKGVTVAVVDTGIYDHPDLNGRIIGFKDFVKNKTDPYDDNGHGTHCAGDIAGDGTASGGKYKGAAPEANLIGVKVLNQLGSGSLSTVMAGVDWCIKNKSEYGIDVISMSLGSDATQSAADDPMVKVVEKAWDSGIVVCVAAGNSGPEAKTIGSPGTSPKVITVGAMDDQNTPDRSDDKVADFSSRGPTIDGVTKPDVLTPGVNIISLRSPGSMLDKTMKKNRVDEDYFSLSGTSMATPICAGVTALILQNNPNLSPDEVKVRLISGAEDWGLDPNTQGYGYVDAMRSID